LVLLGLELGPSWTIDINAFASSANRAAATPVAYASGSIPASFSVNRSADKKKFLFQFPSARSERFWQIVITNTTGATAFNNIWKALFLETIQPVTNVEAGSGPTIDDRSERRYTRSGRRVIDPTVVCPAFQGAWPWLTAAEAHRIRKMMYQRGGSYPVVFCLDPEDTVWGEDYLYYGDLEKSMKIDLDNDDLNAFSFSIVSIAP
jgi:hypothetical protein